MTPEKSGTIVGWRVYGLGVIMLGLVCLAWGDFDPGQPVARTFPGRTAFAYAAALFMVIAGAAIEWRRTTAVAAASLAIYYALIVFVVMNGRMIAANYAEFGAFSGAAEQLAIAAGATIIYAWHGDLDAIRVARLVRVGQVTFAICALLFGGAHFFYMNLTAPLVPNWLPPSQQFWGYATGCAHIAAGVAILIGVQARLAAILLTIMYASFSLLVHVPMLLGEPANHGIWSENALNLALIGVAWVVADSFLQPSSKGTSVARPNG